MYVSFSQLDTWGYMGLKSDIKIICLLFIVVCFCPSSYFLLLCATSLLPSSYIPLLSSSFLLFTPTSVKFHPSLLPPSLFHPSFLSPSSSPLPSSSTPRPWTSLPSPKSVSQCPCVMWRLYNFSSLYSSHTQTQKPSQCYLLFCWPRKHQHNKPH